MENLKTPTKTGRKIKPKFTWEQLEAALFFAFDLFDDAQCEFFPMGKTALQMYDSQTKEVSLEGDKITLGVRKKDLAESTIEMLKISSPSIDIQDRKIIIEHEGVPIEIKIISKHYRVLDNLDSIDYAYETFLIPNPFDAFKRMMWFMY